MTILGDPRLERLADQGRGVEGAKPVRQRAFHHRAEAVRVERLEHPFEHARRATPQAPLLRRFREEAADGAGKIHPPHPPRHHRRREEIVLEEIRQGIADPVLVARDDRGVRDRQAERMAEQGRDREPVGDATDQTRLGEGADEAPGGMGVGEIGDGDEDRRHPRKHRRGQGPHAARIPVDGRAAGAGAAEQAHRV